MARRTQYRLTMPVVPEHSIQTALAKTLTIEIAPAGKLSRHGVVWWSVDHANYAGEVPGIRISRGIIAGIPDTFLLFRGRAHLLELKAENGRLSEPQQAVMAAAILGGARCGVIDDAMDALRVLDEWEIPRNRRIMRPLPTSDDEAA